MTIKSWLSIYVMHFAKCRVASMRIK